jgi:hypothetical protein
MRRGKTRTLDRKSMNTGQLRQQYGEEYPAAITLYGVRMPLVHDGRFAREYRSEEAKAAATISKFQDGTATMTIEQLRGEWGGWSHRDRHEFCSGCSWLLEQADLRDMLRFVMTQPEPEYWSSVALAVAHYIPKDEAFGLLRHALANIDSHTANVTQGIAATKHPEAKPLLEKHLEHLWIHPDLWADDPFNNWRAFDATCCIANLLELDAQPTEYEAKVRALSRHVCAGNRQSCGTFLHQYYDWLHKPQIPSPFAV